MEFNLALAFYKSGQTETAAGMLEKVHRAEPDELQPVLLLADCRLGMGENKKVIELLTPFAERRPDDLAIAYLLGTALVRDDQPGRGQVIVNQILRHGDSAETWLLLGTAKLNAANPYDFTANLQLAVLLREDEKIPEALACLRRAQQVRPNELGVRYQLAALAFDEGNLDSARRDPELIVKEAPCYTEAHVTRATVYYRLKRKEDGDRERAMVQKLNAEAQVKQQQGVNVK